MLEILAQVVGEIANQYLIGFLILFVFIHKIREDSIGLIYLLFFTTIYNAVLKEVFKMPLPETCPSTSYGFPSGHTNFYSILCIWIFISYKSKYIKTLSILVFCLAEWRIVYLGYHYLRDVLLTPLFALTVTYLYKKFVSDFSDYKKLVIFAVVNALLIMTLIWLTGYWSLPPFYAYGLSVIAPVAKRLVLRFRPT